MLSRAKQNIVRDRSVLHICISMFLVNNVIFSVFFVNNDVNHIPTKFTNIFTSVLCLFLVPSLFLSGVYCDRYSSWKMLIGLYLALILSLLIYSLEGEDDTWY